MIDGVAITKLRVVPDERGFLMEMFRSDDEQFDRFGQAYITTTYPGVIKGWHLHNNQVDNIVCVKGMIKLVLFDPREDSPTRGEVQEIFSGDHNRIRIRIPKGIYHGWKCVSEIEAYIVNIPDQLYDYDDPDEHRLPFDSDRIPYDWSIRMG